MIAGPQRVNRSVECFRASPPPDGSGRSVTGTSIAEARLAVAQAPNEAARNNLKDLIQKLEAGQKVD